MENLHRHIIYLLSRRDCVILPGVGAFIAERRQAAYNPATGRWVPPTRHISFNAAVRTDDGLLSHSYSRAMGVDYEHGRKEMEVAVAGVLDVIREKGRYTLGTLGTLSSNDEGRLTFSPFITPGRRSGRIGYHAFSLPVLPVKKSDVSENVDSDIIQTEESPVIRRVPRLTRMRRNIAVACSIAVILICGVLLYNIPGPVTQLASVLPVPATKTAVQKPMKQTVATAVNQPADSIIVGSSIENTESVAPEETEATYHLIVATFNTEREAEKYIAQQPAQEAKDLYSVRGIHVTRVAIAGSDSRDKLLSTLRSPEMRQKHPNAWIWSAN